MIHREAFFFFHTNFTLATEKAKKKNVGKEAGFLSSFWGSETRDGLRCRILL